MKAVTGNRLDDGAVVYLDDRDEWISDLSRAARFEDDDSRAVLAAAQSRVTEIAGAYLIDVNEAGPAGREALRETIRQSGPTVREDLSYQAECCA